jgi:hypothetical protein
VVEVTGGAMFDGPQKIIGQCRVSEGRILIAGDVAPQLRLGVLFHELRHAYLIHFAGNELPATIEADCASTSTFAMMVIRELARLGWPMLGPAGKGGWR